MAGGIFKNQPFVLNPKCIIYSLVNTFAYMIMGGRNIFFIFLISLVSYVSLAWYDWYYECEYDKMYSGTSYLGNPTALFKPQNRPEDLLQKQEQTYLKKVYGFHFFIIAPLLIYIGIKRTKTPDFVLKGIGGLGALAFAYHGFRLFVQPRIE